MAKKTAKKVKQLKIPGTERKGIREVDDAAEAFRIARDKRMAMTKVEKEKKTLLMGIVKKHGLESYVYDDEDGEEEEVLYKAETAEDVKVKKVKAKPDPAGDEG